MSDGRIDLWNRGQRKGRNPDPSGYRFYVAFHPSMNDDAGGNATGTAGAAIQRPPHILKHFVYGIIGESVNNFTSSGFGSFATAASDLDDKTDAIATGEDYIMMYRNLDSESPDEMIGRLCRQAPLTIFRSMYDGKWKAVAYQQSPSSEKYFTDPSGNNYKLKYTTDVVRDSLTVSKTPLSECINEVHIQYAQFAPTGEYTKDCWVGPSGSDDGDGTRDQNTSSPDNREARAAGSRDDLNVKGSLIVAADCVNSSNVALVLRNYLFDRYHRPRVLLSMSLGPRFIGLEPGMCLLVDNELQDYEPVPYYPGDGVGGGTAKEWDDLIFFVRDLAITLQGGVPVVSVTLEEIR